MQGERQVLGMREDSKLTKTLNLMENILASFIIGICYWLQRDVDVYVELSILIEIVIFFSYSFIIGYIRFLYIYVVSVGFSTPYKHRDASKMMNNLKRRCQ